MRTKFVPMLASLRRLGISILWLTGEVGSSTRPSIESHIRNRMFAGFLARGAAWVVAASSARRRPSTRAIGVEPVEAEHRQNASAVSHKPSPAAICPFLLLR